MKAIRWVLLAFAAAMVVAGLVLSFLPYDATVQGPALAGDPGRQVTVSCKAPIIDLFSKESDDAWLNYSPNEGVVFESSGRAGGEFCNDTMQTRGIFGIVLIMGGACFALAAFIARNRGRHDPADAQATDEPGTDEPGTDEPGTDEPASAEPVEPGPRAGGPSEDRPAAGEGTD